MTTARIVPASFSALPIVVAAGDRAQMRFWEFFVSNIRNPHTRHTYKGACKRAHSSTYHH
jgi:hypothetical protein